jgi:hypothetical protein
MLWNVGWEHTDSRLKWNPTITKTEDDKERKEEVTITRITKQPRTGPTEVMDVTSQQATTRGEEQNPRNMRYNCEPYGDLGSCSHTMHTSHSMGTNMPFTLQRRLLPICAAFSMTINEAQRQAIRQSGFYFPKTFISSQTTLYSSLKVYSLHSLMLPLRIRFYHVFLIKPIIWEIDLFI